MANSQLLAKNTFFLYVRMAITILVGLYTSRVVLNVLGVEDYGIYGVVGGVVSMFGFINATMSSATSRFIAFELGKGNQQRLKSTFSSALLCHIIIIIVVVFLSETIGLWFLYNKMIIPASRMHAAMWVYQLSILSICFSFSQVPYNATIIAHEKMKVYAYVEIINAVLKLAVVLILQIFCGDKLIIYAVLVLLVSILIMSVYRVYCIRNFQETHIKFVWDTSILKPMVSFSGWDLLSNFSGVARQQGVNIILNIFFGPLLNAASSIATTASGFVMQFATNISMALKPQIIKSYAKKEYDETVDLIKLGYLSFFILLSLVSVPLICEMHYILLKWLKIVPDYAVPFCQLLLLFNIASCPSHAILPAIHATGDIKRASIIMATLYIAVLPITYFAYKWNYNYAPLPYVVNVITVFLGMLSNSYILSKKIKQFSFAYYIKDMFLKMVLPLCVFIGSTYYITTLMEEGIIRLIITTSFSSIIILLMSYFYLIPSRWRRHIATFIKTRLCKRA